MHDIGLISQVKILINSISIIDARDENRNKIFAKASEFV